MDGLRSFDTEFHAANDPFDSSPDYEDAAIEAPSPVGQDERRMQVRAYNFWASHLDDRKFPPVAPLMGPDQPDFAANAVLLKFAGDLNDPFVALLGDKLASECDATQPISRLSDIPGRSLLSRITDHYLQIIANEAPIGFEAEFVNLRGTTVLYRGILLPFSSDGETIDYIYGVINWKEVADQATTDALMAEVGLALKKPDRRPQLPMTDWADGPASIATPAQRPVSDLDVPGPAFGEAADTIEEQGPLGYCAPLLPSGSLSDLLAAARACADFAHSSEDRTRSALYAAIGRAWDFALAARDEPGEFDELIADAGLVRQNRAPMTPVVKLVFGANYDKTRLTEYAAALLHAQRQGIGAGQLARYLADAPGGLKGVVSAERRLRRDESERPAPRRASNGLQQRLRTLPERPIEALPCDGAEFALVLVRRNGKRLSLIGEVIGDDILVERAARQLVNTIKPA